MTDKETIELLAAALREALLAIETAQECSGVEWVELIIADRRRPTEDDVEVRRESKATVYCLLSQALERGRAALATTGPEENDDVVRSAEKDG